MKLVTYIHCCAFLLFFGVAFVQINIEFQQLQGENVSTQSVT